MDGRMKAKKKTEVVQPVGKGVLTVSCEDEDQDKVLAQTALQPTINAAATIRHASKTLGELHLMELIKELQHQASEVNSGNQQRSEGMLIAQAHTLDMLFNELTRRSINNLGQLNIADQYMRLALKAQSQCRTTLETLSEIKNPRSIAFVKQANIAQNQQVNNLRSEAELSARFAQARAGEIKNHPNQLLEIEHGKRLDTGATGKAGGVDTELEALAPVYRPKNSRG